MTTTIWLDRTKDKKEYDVVIVGAGIAGLSTAYWLKKEDPDLRVALLEKGKLGAGATGRNAGFVTCGSVEHFNRLIEKHGPEEATEIWKFSEHNLELLKQEIVQGSKSDLHFYQTGTFSIASSDTELKELEGVAKLMEERDIKVEYIDKAGCESRLGVKNFVGGIKYLEDAEVHPVSLLQEILSKIDIDFIEQTEVHRVEEADSGGRLVFTDNGTFEASMVIFATNGYSAQLEPFFKDKIFPTRGQILVLEKQEKFMEAPVYANFYLDYFRQLDSGELIIGGFRQVEKETETGYSDHTTEPIQTALHDFVKNHLPQFLDAKVLYRWGGIMGFSADGQPMIGALPKDNQVFYIGGFTAHGLGIAFHAGKCLVDMIFGREIPSFLSGKRWS